MARNIKYISVTIHNAIKTAALPLKTLKHFSNFQGSDNWVYCQQSRGEFGFWCNINHHQQQQCRRSINLAFCYSFEAHQHFISLLCIKINGNFLYIEYNHTIKISNRRIHKGRLCLFFYVTDSKIYLSKESGLKKIGIVLSTHHWKNPKVIKKGLNLVYTWNCLKY